MARAGTSRTCPKGHRYIKSSDCPTCPQCDAERFTTDGWMAKLGAPARRALEHARITTLAELAKRSRKELLALHGFGPATLPTLQNELSAAGLQFTERTTRTMRDPTKKPTNTEEYLAQLPADQRQALQALRKQILAAAPGAEEHFGYGLPGFKYNSHPLGYMGAAKNHVALYGSVPLGFKERLKDFSVSKGTIQFTPEKPLPAALVKEIVRAKCAEIDLRWPVVVKKVAVKKAPTQMTAKRR